MQIQNKKYWITAIVLGFFFAIVFFFSPASLFIFFLGFFIILTINFWADKDERKFLTHIFIWGMILRIFLALLIQFILISKEKWAYYEGGDRFAALFGDDATNNIYGWWIAKYVSGEPLTDFLRLAVSSGLGEYGRSGYVYIVALFHYLFGRSPISIIFLNCIFSVLTSITYYFIAKEIASINAARISAVLVTFLPSLVLWSVSSFKEPLFILLTGIILWIFLQWYKNHKIKYLILLILALLLQYSIRLWVLFPTLVVLGLSYLVLKRKIKIIFVFLLMIILTGNLSILDALKSRVINYHRGVVSSGGITYRIYDDWVYQPETDTTNVTYSDFFRGLLRGWLHFLLEPFPWNIQSKSFLMAYPQIIIWYFILPLSIWGILIQLRYNPEKSLVLILYFLITGSVLALTGGNIGTDFRMREMLTPIVILFFSIAVIKIFYFKQNNFIFKKNL